MSNLYLLSLKLQSAEQPLRLATITRTVGSVPQKPGSSALFDHNGLISGTINCEILESKIRELSLQSLHSKKSSYFHLDLSKEIEKEEELLCEGQVEILIESLTSDSITSIEKMKESLGLRTPGVLATMIKNIGDDGVSIERTWITERTADPLGDIPVKEIKRLIAGRDPFQYSEVKISEHGSLMFLEPIFPPPRLIIAGGGHIGKALSHLAKLLDFEITVIDDREEYANHYNLPDADHIIVGNIGEVLDEMDLTHDTFVVIATKDFKDDAKALRPCIGSEAAYIGVVGSRNKISVMREEFIKKGWAEPREWKDIHAPACMIVQPKTAQEIAMSIAAELMQITNGIR